MTGDLEDRLYGCLIGGAIGDALGAVVENWSYERIRDEYDKIDTFRSYDNPHARGTPGAVTDDSVMQQYLCLSIVENEGRVTPDEFGDTLLEYLNPDRVWVTEEITIRKLATGMNPWDSGRQNIRTGSATMMIAPIGIINAANPRQAYQDGFNIASVTQDKVDRDAAATVAAGVAEAFSPGATVTDVIKTMLEYSSELVYRGLDLAIGLAEESESFNDYVALFYDELLDWTWPAVEWNREKYYQGEIFGASSREFLPAIVGLLYLWDGDDSNRIIIEGASFGRDADTIASLTGNFASALNGASSLRDQWIDQCEKANEEFFEELHGDPNQNFAAMASRLGSVLDNERDRAADRIATLNELLYSEKGNTEQQ
jgi:ADP-ribosylglycohydrolase